MILFKFDDGGRAACGIKGKGGDCVTRAIAIATQQSYSDVLSALSDGCRTQRRSKRGKPLSSARNGVNTNRKWFRDYMSQLGWEFVPTMSIGSGCNVHLRADELPSGRIIVSVSRHYAAVIDGVLHDTHDCSRGGSRCVYGYWKKLPIK